ncbi:hypothetical protein E5Q_00449 [Mixia osmundae IAM 14324]|uniref:Uncharacterized protein n=1 Tax=Mixia osmundae (strain CBS 9802 / IAM 14324 / JCM 22182 / KY 12970) TaxID=764103 RepID=G7DTF5_MIXOS|nr:hypothetical protein E5Q_00449 [Mixia osmundae IAM 14324]
MSQSYDDEDIIPPSPGNAREWLEFLAQQQDRPTRMHPIASSETFCHGHSPLPLTHGYGSAGEATPYDDCLLARTTQQSRRSASQASTIASSSKMTLDDELPAGVLDSPIAADRETLSQPLPSIAPLTQEELEIAGVVRYDIAAVLSDTPQRSSSRCSAGPRSGRGTPVGDQEIPPASSPLTPVSALSPITSPRRSTPRRAGMDDDHTVMLDQAAALLVHQQEEERGPYAHALRKRTAMQKNPYSLEQLKYKASLKRYNWSDAVVTLPRIRDVLPEGASIPDSTQDQTVRTRVAPELQDFIVRESQESVVITPEMQAQRKAALVRRREARAWRKAEAKRKQEALRKAAEDAGGLITSDSDDDCGLAAPVLARRKPPRASTQPARKRPRPRPVLRTEQEAPSTEPLLNGVSSPHVPSPARPAIVPLSSDHESDDEATHAERRLQRRQTSPQSAVSLSDSDLEAKEVNMRVGGRASRFELKGSKGRALRGMMPATFFRSAQNDLKRMADERRQKHAHLSTNHDLDGADGLQRAVIIRKRKPAQGARPIILDGAAFTDDSDSDERPPRALSTDSGSSNDERFAEQDDMAWITRFAQGRPEPRQAPPQSSRKRKRHRPRQYHHRSPLAARDINLDTSPRQPNRATVRKVIRHDHKRPPLRLDTQESLFGHFSIRPRSAKTRRQRGSAHRERQSPADFDGAEAHDDHRLETSLPSVTPRTSNGLLELDTLHNNTPARPLDESPSQDWLSVTGFTYDFGLERISAHCAFSASTYLGKGSLQEVLDASQSIGMRHLFAFDTFFDISMDSRALLSALPAMFDAVFDRVQLASAINGMSSNDCAIAASSILDVLHFFGLAIGSHTSVSYRHIALIDAVLGSLEHLEERQSLLPESTPQLVQLLAGLEWATIDFSLQAVRALTDLQSQDGVLLLARLEATVTNALSRLLRQLFGIGLTKLAAFVKGLHQMEANSKTSLEDYTTQLWICLINFALDAPPSTRQLCDPQKFWLMVEDELEWHLAESSMQQDTLAARIAANEARACTAMLLCALSQFDRWGMSDSPPRLPARWAAINVAFTSIDIKDLETSSSMLSHSALSRRDGYIWTLCARCLICSERWGWSMEMQTGIIQQVYDMLNARKLAPLATDRGHDLPVLVQSLPCKSVPGLDPDRDSALHILLKLLLKTAEDLEVLSPSRKAKTLTPLLMRISPMRTISSASTTDQLNHKQLSMLVNHYCLFLTIMSLKLGSPNSHLRRFWAVSAFPKADQAARKLQLRAILLLAGTFHRMTLSLEPILAVVFANMRTLLHEHETASRDFENLHRDLISTDRFATGKLGNDEARLYAKLSTRSADAARMFAIVQHLIGSILQIACNSSGQDAAYPPEALFDECWTSSPLNRPALVFHRSAGPVIIGALQSVLDLRRAAICKQLSQAERSQDEYGSLDIDFDDPALAELLGAPGSQRAPMPSQETAAQRLHTQDNRLIEFATRMILPGLASNVVNFVPQSRHWSAETVMTVFNDDHVARAHLEALVKCWVGYCHLAVAHNSRQWSDYVRPGPHSLHRIVQQSHRREVAVLFINEMVCLEPVTLQHFGNEIILAWLQAISRPTLTQAHRNLTRMIFGRLRMHALLLDAVPAAEGESSSEREDMDMLADNLEYARVPLLSGIFKNINRELTEGRPSVPAGQLFACMHGLLQSMNDYRKDLKTTVSTERQANYELFCRAVIGLLQERIPSVDEHSVSSLKLFV